MRTGVHHSTWTSGTKALRFVGRLIVAGALDRGETEVVRFVDLGFLGLEHVGDLWVRVSGTISIKGCWMVPIARENCVNFIRIYDSL